MFVVLRGNGVGPVRLSRGRRRDGTKILDSEGPDFASQKTIGCCQMARWRPLHPTAASWATVKHRYVQLLLVHHSTDHRQDLKSQVFRAQQR